MKERKVGILLGAEIILRINMPKNMKDLEESRLDMGEKYITDHLGFKPITKEELEAEVKRDLFN